MGKQRRKSRPIRVKTWLFRSEAKHGKALVLINSPFKRQAQKKLIPVADGFGFLEWTCERLEEETAKTMLLTYELNTFYSTDAGTV